MKLHLFGDPNPSYGTGQTLSLLSNAFPRLGVDVSLNEPPKVPRVVNLFIDSIEQLKEPQALGANVAYTWWETTRLPERHVEKLNKYDLVLAGSAWCATAFKRSGVRNVTNVSTPYNAEAFQFSPGRVPRFCVFGFAGNVDHGLQRKGLELCYRAFSHEFGTDPTVQLRILSKGGAAVVPERFNVQVLEQVENVIALRRWYEELTALIVPSKAEGFGLHGIEALACGRTVIAPRYSGMMEYYRAGQASLLPLEFRECPARDRYYQTGNWAEVSEDSLRMNMRFVAQCQLLVLANGVKSVDELGAFHPDAVAARIKEVLW